MKKSKKLCFRISPEMRELWDELNEKSECRTQSALLRQMITEKSNQLKNEDENKMDLSPAGWVGGV